MNIVIFCLYLWLRKSISLISKKCKKFRFEIRFLSGNYRSIKIVYCRYSSSGKPALLVKTCYIHLCIILYISNLFANVSVVLILYATFCWWQHIYYTYLQRILFQGLDRYNQFSTSESWQQNRWYLLQSNDFNSFSLNRNKLSRYERVMLAQSTANTITRSDRHTFLLF